MDNQSPMVKIEFEYEDGSVQRLRGPACQQWLQEVNDVIIFTTTRCGQQQLSDYQWEWTHKEDANDKS